MLRDGYFIAIYLANNEYGLCFVIPDAPWVKGELRELIEDILDPLPTTDTQEKTHERLLTVSAISVNSAGITNNCSVNYPRKLYAADS
jgi:hypothetical protein